jgi:hypothetical protein
MNRRFFSWLSLAVLVAGLFCLASGLGTLVAAASSETATVIPALTEMGVGVVSWIWGVQMTRAAHVAAPAVAQITRSADIVPLENFRRRPRTHDRLLAA